MSVYKHIEPARMSEQELHEYLAHIDNQMTILDFQIRNEADPQIKVRLMQHKRKFGRQVDDVLDALEQRTSARMLPMH